MKHRTGSVLGTLRGMATMLDDRPELAPLKSSGTRKVLDATIAQFDEYASDQVSGQTGSRGATVTKHDLIEALRTDHMKPIVNAAKLGVPDAPQLEAFKMPPANISEAKLIAAARGLSDAAKQHETAIMAAGGLDADFIAQLDAARDAVVEATSGRVMQTTKQIGGTKGLLTEESRARALIKIVDGKVRPLIRNNAALLTAWKSAIRVPSKPGVKTGAAAAAAATAAVNADIAQASAQPAATPATAPTTPAAA